MKQLRTSKEGTFQERSMAILEKQIQMEEIDRGIVAREQAQNKGKENNFEGR